MNLGPACRRNPARRKATGSTSPHLDTGKTVAGASPSRFSAAWYPPGSTRRRRRMAVAEDIMLLLLLLLPPLIPK